MKLLYMGLYVVIIERTNITPKKESEKMSIDVLRALIQLDQVKDNDLTKKEMKLRVTRAINLLEREFPEFKVEKRVIA